MTAVEVGLAAEALFCSHVQPSDPSTSTQVDRVVRSTLARLGADEVAALVAQEFGDHPEVARKRMVWCRHTIRTATRIGVR